MAELDVAGSFLITIGRGAGPETCVVLSVSDADGKPVVLHFPNPPDADRRPVYIFVALSAMFGAFEIPLRIVEVQPQEAGFYGLGVEGPRDLGVRLEQIRPSTLGIVVETGADRGQALACACPAADVTPWFGGAVQHP
jgi:hypothetical protein